MVEAYPSPREAISEVSRGTVTNEEEQLLAIEKFVFVTGSDVFVSLPTGFGKSLIYRLLLAVFNRLKVYRKPTSFALNVSPLTSLVIDQKGRVLPRGISAKFLGEAQHDARALQPAREGLHQLVFLTPENLFHGQNIRETLMAESFQSKFIS